MSSFNENNNSSITNNHEDKQNSIIKIDKDNINEENNNKAIDNNLPKNESDSLKLANDKNEDEIFTHINTIAGLNTLIGRKKGYDQVVEDAIKGLEYEISYVDMLKITDFIVSITKYINKNKDETFTNINTIAGLNTLIGRIKGYDQASVVEDAIKGLGYKIAYVELLKIPDYIDSITMHINKNKETVKLCENMDCQKFPYDWDFEKDTEETYQEDQWKKCGQCVGYYDDDGMCDILFVQEEPNNQEAECSLCGKTKDIVQMKGSGQYLCGNACDESDESDEDDE